jgi:acid phosphatase
LLQPRESAGKLFPLKGLRVVKNLRLNLAIVFVMGVAPLMTLGQQAMSQARPQSRAGQPVFSVDGPGERIENIDDLKKELKAYHACTCKCGCYTHDLDVQADKAVAFLRRRAAHVRPNEKLAMVFDIDETSLSNWTVLVQEDFTYDKKASEAWEETGQAPVIPGSLRVEQEAERLGVAVFFITGRPEREREATEQNLKAQGFGGWQQLSLRSAAMEAKMAEEYKSSVRGEIAAQGYKIVLNVGDQWSDLKGKPEAEYSVKYPNPFYLIP